jgi:hypothetical protein
VKNPEEERDREEKKRKHDEYSRRRDRQQARRRAAVTVQGDQNGGPDACEDNGSTVQSGDPALAKAAEENQQTIEMVCQLFI